MIPCSHPRRAEKTRFYDPPHGISRPGFLRLRLSKGGSHESEQKDRSVSHFGFLSGGCCAGDVGRVGWGSRVLRENGRSIRTKSQRTTDGHRAISPFVG